MNGLTIYNRDRYHKHLDVRIGGRRPKYCSATRKQSAERQAMFDAAGKSALLGLAESMGIAIKKSKVESMAENIRATYDRYGWPEEVM